MFIYQFIFFGKSKQFNINIKIILTELKILLREFCRIFLKFERKKVIVNFYRLLVFSLDNCLLLLEFIVNEYIFSYI